MKKLPLITICTMVLLFGITQAIANPVKPTNEGAIYTLQVGNLELVVNAEHGAKVISLKIDGNEFLMTDPSLGKDVYFGSTVWPSPQSEMGFTANDDNVWHPTPLLLDTGTYAPTLTDTSMTFVSVIDEDKLGNSMQFIKTYSANSKDTSITLTYSLVNKSAESITKGLWELTRVPAEGLFFYPKGDDLPWGDGDSDLSDKVLLNGDYYWYPFSQDDGGRKKFYGNSLGGWYGYVNNSNHCFIKEYEDPTKEEIAEGDDEIAYWIDEDFYFIELENISAAKELADGDTVTYTVKWYLRNLPADVDVSVGSSSLTDYAIFVMTPKVVPSILNNYSIAVHKIYPNPARNKLHIEFNEPLLNPAEINLFNLTGKQVLSSIISGNSTIDISNLPSGVYVYSINSGDVISRGKLIKE